MSELSLEQRTAARKICPECVNLYEMLEKDINEIDAEKQPTETNYSQLIRVVGIVSWPIVTGGYILYKFYPEIIDYINSIPN